MPSTRLFRRMANLGWSRHCPACGSHVRAFLPTGRPPRADARCPVCNSTERERAQVLLLKRRILPSLALKSPFRVLHFAPEPGVERVLRKAAGDDYLSADVEHGRAMRRLDMTELGLEDASLDFVFASHVFEHITEDRRAARELFRILEPGGVAFIEVPVLRETTYEDPSITSASERERTFGQCDHVRVCGKDYSERFAQAGFDVRDLWIDREFVEDEIRRMRLCSGRKDVFYVSWLCRKPTEP